MNKQNKRLAEELIELFPDGERGGGVWFSFRSQIMVFFSDEGNNKFVTKHVLMT